MALALAIVALLLALIVLVKSKGENLLGWAVLALALIHLLPFGPFPR